MRTKTIRVFILAILSLVFLCLPFLIFAADPAVAAPGSAGIPAGGPDFSLSWFQWLIPILVPLLIAGLKKLWPSVPGHWLPYLCPALGLLADTIAKLAGSAGAGPEVAAALGALGLFLRELVDQSRKALNQAGGGKLALLALCLCASVAITGCVSPTKHLAAMVKELAKDPATVNVRVTSIYGTVTFTRTAPTTNSLAHSINPDGTVTVGPRSP